MCNCKCITVGIKPEEGFGDLLPSKAYEGDAAYDLKAAINKDESLLIPPGGRILVSNGFKCDIPDGYEIQVRPRSGLAIKYGITVLNAPGTIDSGYKGVVGTVLINLGDKDFVINRGDRISQMVIAKVANVCLGMVTNVGDSERGEGGFGSTGVSSK